MKKWLIILILSFSGLAAFTQQPDDDDDVKGGGKVVERMREYISDRLGMTKAEAQRFTPVFVRYFREFRQTFKEFKTDRLIFKQKIIDLRIRYRTEFRQIMDEQRANKVFLYEDEFRKRAIDAMKENRLERRGTIRRTGVLFR